MDDLREHSRTRGLWLPALLVLFLLPALPAQAGRMRLQGKPYRDRVHKFSLKVFEDYKPVPLPPDAGNLVARFGVEGSGDGQNRGVQEPELEVYRFLKGDRTDEAITGEDDPGGTMPGLPPGVRMPGREPVAKDLWDQLIGPYTRPRPWNPSYKPLELDREDFDDIKSKDRQKVPGKKWEYTIEVPTWMNETMEMVLTLAVFEKDDVEVGIWVTVPGVLWKDYKSAVKSMIKGFRWHDEKADEVETRDELDGVNISARRRRQIEKNIVQGWDLVVSPKKNYIVVYDTKNNRNHALAKEIAKRIEAIREQVYEVQFPPAKPIKVVSIVRVCRDRQQYHQYGGPGGSAGYWSAHDEELVFYDASPSRKIDDDTLSVLYHEAFHQYIYYSVGDVAPHSWFNEGHGDYYAGAKYRGGKFKIEPFDWRLGVIAEAVNNGPRTASEETDPMGRSRKQWSGNGYTPLSDFVRFTQGEYYSYPSVCYAQGWSLIYFLREVVPKKRQYREKWGHILDVYFDTLKAEVAKGGNLRAFGFELPDEEGEEEADEDADEADADEGEDEEPGEGESGDEEGPDIDEETGGIAMPRWAGLGGPEALRIAIEKAFEGVDYEEFEAAWLKHHKGR